MNEERASLEVNDDNWEEQSARIQQADVELVSLIAVGKEAGLRVHELVLSEDPLDKLVRDVFNVHDGIAHIDMNFHKEHYIVFSFSAVFLSGVIKRDEDEEEETEKPEEEPADDDENQDEDADHTMLAVKVRFI